MNQYIVTFYSHFGAIRFRKHLKQSGIQATVMPVPRSLSSSCGTCVSYQATHWDFKADHNEIEQIVQVSDNEYIQQYRAENS
ncbi:MAG: DUF3343 domain-containing protein [Lachnospiraceae bacterium]